MKKIKLLCGLFSIFFVVLYVFSAKPIRIGADIENILEGGVADESLLVPSCPSGYYEKAFELVFAIPKGLEMFYTLDCSAPTRDSNHYDGAIYISDATQNENVWASMIVGTDAKVQENERYVEPDYKIDKGTVIRAALFDGDKKIGKDFVFTYFVNTSNKEIYEKHPVISIVGEFDDFFSEENGIYTNYWLQGTESERVVYVDYFAPSFKWEYSKKMGIRVRGGASRERIQKGFNLFLREKYGNAMIQNFFSENEQITSFSLVTQYDKVKIKDVLSYYMSDGLDVGRKQCIPCNVFLNGEHWGMYYIAERFDYNYFVRHYGVDEDEVIVMKDGVLERGKVGDSFYFDELVTFVQQNDMADDENYMLFSEKVDVDSLIDYYCLESYIYNRDWPNHNMAMWRTRTRDITNEYADGKWRFLLFDTNYEEAMKLNSGKDSPYELLVEDRFIPYLLKNKEFRERMAIRMCDMANIVAEQYRMEELINQLGEQIKDDVMLSEKRFYGIEKYDVTEKLQQDTFQFFYVRPDYVREETRRTLCPDKIMSSLVFVMDNPNMGSIKVNDLLIDMSMGSWEGKYYSDLHIDIEIIPEEGYTFVGWEDISKSTIFSEDGACEILMPENGIVLKPVFVQSE